MQQVAAALPSTNNFISQKYFTMDLFIQITDPLLCLHEVTYIFEVKIKYNPVSNEVRMFFLLGIDDTDSPTGGDAFSTLPDTAAMALTLGLKLESMGLARLLNISCHQLFQNSMVPYTTSNTAACLFLDTDAQKIREIDMTARLILRGQSSPTANPGYALAAWNQIAHEVVSWSKSAKIAPVQRMDAIKLARQSGIMTAGISGSGSGVIGALSAVGLRYDGNDGFIYWMPGLDKLHGICTQIEINQFIHFESIESEHHKRPALDDRIFLSEKVKPILKEGRIVLQISPAKRGSEFEWLS